MALQKAMQGYNYWCRAIAARFVPSQPFVPLLLSELTSIGTIIS